MNTINVGETSSHASTLLPFVSNRFFPGLSLSCVQCSSVETTSCMVSPPSPSTCPDKSQYCLILKEYMPSRQGNDIWFYLHRIIGSYFCRQGHFLEKFYLMLMSTEIFNTPFSMECPICSSVTESKAFVSNCGLFAVSFVVLFTAPFAVLFAVLF